MAVPPGTVRVEHDAVHHVLVLVGEHDVSTRCELEGALAGVEPDRALLVDLLAASFVDASIMGLLLREADRRPGLRVVAAPGTVTRRLVELVAPELLDPAYASGAGPGARSPTTKISTTTSESGST